MIPEQLKRYYAILAGEEKARYLLCPDLGEKIKAAEEMLKSCHFCEHRCGVDRTSGQRGYCQVLESRVSSDFIHIGEESHLVPSYTIFFSGCTFKCVYCQNYDISQRPAGGIYIRPEDLAVRINRQNARNVNWVGGDPTPNLSYILKVLGHLERNIPQVWNSNMYLTEESMNLLDNVIDVYLTDYKYGNDECALRLSDAANYMEVIQRNHLIANKQCEVIIRHLVLPEHLDCCTKPALKWISENLDNVFVNVMGQYRPEYRAGEYPELSRRLYYEELRDASDYAKSLDLSLL